MTFTCLHCKTRLAPVSGPAILGQSAEQQIAKGLEQLNAHIQLRHQDKFAETMVLIGQAGALGILCHFESPHPLVRQYRNNAAAELRKACARVLTDEDIERIVLRKSMGLDRMKTSDVLALLKDMREFLNYGKETAGGAAPAAISPPEGAA